MAEHTTLSTTTTLAEPDAAHYIGYRPAALRAWRREGRGPAYVRHGRSVRYLVADLDAWLGAHRVEPAAERGARG
ncbi:MAG: helix-turn-helix transcriptional regulator [Vicinamibacterales bacterium]